MKLKSLTKLEKELENELNLLNVPANPWILPSRAFPRTDYDVAIIGAGMAGLAAAFGLFREGISNIAVFDAGINGYEGPWATYARMLTLRSGKKLPGPALDIPNLTFEAWYKAQFGDEKWENLYKIPTLQWMEYLRWYRKVLNIPVINQTKVLQIKPQGPNIKLELENDGEKRLVTTRKVVLSTGRGGWGEVIIPKFIQNIPQEYYAHTWSLFNLKQLKGKRVAIIGVGASGFDAAAAALESGAEFVQILTRRKHIGYINKFRSLVYPGFSLGYYNLDDEAKIKFMEHATEEGAVPPFESLRRIEKYPNTEVLTNVAIAEAKLEKDKVILNTNQGPLTYDFIILATGFEVDGSKQTELQSIYPEILLWKDKFPKLTPRMGKFPYLGQNFQFLGKENSRTGYLQNIYCYNYAAFLSHGIISGDIPNISVGVKRLAEGIASDFFTQDWQSYYKELTEFEEPEFRAEEYTYIKHP